MLCSSCSAECKYKININKVQIQNIHNAKNINRLTVRIILGELHVYMYVQ